jgi:8-hydroxy-5-deazaflavin:NADPH oxidoreductase
VDEVVEAPIVLLAAPWTRVQAILAGIRSWDQRILIDATNHFLNRKMELAN